MSATNDLLEGIAQYLDDLDIGVYDPTGVYESTDTGIFVGVLPDEPATVISLQKYDQTDMVKLSDSTVYIQAHVRADGYSTAPLDALCDAVFDALHGLSAISVGGVYVVQAQRTISAVLQPDQNGRFQRADSYEFLTNIPTTHRSE